MNKNKKKLIVFIIITFCIIIISSFLIYYFLFFKKNKLENEDSSEKIVLKGAEQYFIDNMDTYEVSIDALIKNKYLSNQYGYDNCNLITKKQDLIEITNIIDCEKSLEYTKYPVVLINGYDIDGYKVNINDWNKDNIKIVYEFKNNEESFYKEDDIINMTWFDLDGNILSESNELFANNINGITKVRLSLMFKDYNYNKTFTLKIDKKAPILKKTLVNNNFPYAYYEDDFAFNSVLYFESKKELKEFDKTKFCTIEKEYECGVMYYIYSYANDLAGNESEISFLGKYSYDCNSNVVTGGNKKK